MDRPTPHKVTDKEGNVISMLHAEPSLDEKRLQQQMRTARMRTDVIVAERLELAKRLLQHLPSSGEDRFKCLCGCECAQASDWASHAAEKVLMPNVDVYEDD
jgi:4-aminobutyrate aminotransferase-like enzyme